MIEFLVPQFGMRVYEKNFFRETCRDKAVAGGHQHVVEYLDSDFPTLKAKVSATSAQFEMDPIVDLVGYKCTEQFIICS